MSYKQGIVEAITDLKDRNGSSIIAIKKAMQGKLPKDKKWQNATFLLALKAGVTAGDFVQVKVCTCTGNACKHLGIHSRLALYRTIDDKDKYMMQR